MFVPFTARKDQPKGEDSTNCLCSGKKIQGGMSGNGVQDMKILKKKSQMCKFSERRKGIWETKINNIDVFRLIICIVGI